MRLVASIRSAAGAPDSGAGDALVIVASVDGVPRWRASFARRRQPLLPGRPLRIAALGAPVAADRASEGDSREAAYRAILDRVVADDPRPDRIHITLDHAHAADADILWRLAIALDARCTVASEHRVLVVDIALQGIVASLAGTRSRLPWGELAAAFRARLAFADRPAAGELLYLARSTEAHRAAARPPHDVRFEFVDRAEAEERPGRFGWPLAVPIPPDEEQRCFAGFAGDELVFRMWVAFGERAVHGRPREAIAPGAAALTAYASHAWTAPRHRGRGIYPSALHWLAAQCRARGIEHLLISVRADNAPSLAGVRKAGFTVVASQPL